MAIVPCPCGRAFDNERVGRRGAMGGVCTNAACGRQICFECATPCAICGNMVCNAHARNINGHRVCRSHNWLQQMTFGFSERGRRR